MSRPKLDDVDDDEAELFSDVPVDDSYLSESDLGFNDGRQQIRQGETEQLAEGYFSGLNSRQSSHQQIASKSDDVAGDVGIMDGEKRQKRPASNSPQTSVPNKRPKIAEKIENVLQLRVLVCDEKQKHLRALRNKHREHSIEMFFLQHGGNLMNYFEWRKRPNPQLDNFLRSSKLDSDDEADTGTLAAQTSDDKADNDTQLSVSSVKTDVALEKSMSMTDATSSGVHVPSLKTASTEPTKTSVATPVNKLAKSASLASSSQRPTNAPASVTERLESTIGSQETIVEKAKQEAQVLQRIAELRKQGMWSLKRLPKVQESARCKAHWDYVLEEMQWLAADFAQERKWKRAGARKIAKMIMKYHQDKEQREVRAEKEEGLKLRRIASNIAKMVKEFWSNIEKVVQYKSQSRMEEKRKKVMDEQLSFIVDQTEKFSMWLTEGLASGGAGSHSAVSQTSRTTSQSPTDDGDFQPSGSDSDDEETIQQAEKDAGQNAEATKAELEDLQRENEMSLEELLQTLPSEILEKPASVENSEEEDSLESTDDDFDASGEESGDEEETIEEQEEHEADDDYNDELNSLRQEGELPIGELMKQYSTAAAGSEPMEADDDRASSITESTDTQKSSNEPGTASLLDLKDESGPSKEMVDISETAMMIQPTGYTLETTQVKVPVPFLLKHTLREYQHVGLDWMATLHDRMLNGILADEMGLGKTIQTIALLAHLACDKGIWGPHLIVVPTSVMLNWEMEFKKWCPAFKILTYYGNVKERRTKRTGWTKTNAFHVCITSYKLVVQDHQAFRRKKWRYFILDEAQNIKNFKSQRWQMLLNFNSQRRVLLTGTPLQNSLMELWSLMHFLMPHVFQSHHDFKEWFANPLTGMIEGSHEYNENLIKRLHKVLRPFLLRRLKQDVEKQMPKKYEHVVMCHLSKRQRFLYDDFMAQASTKDTLAGGHFLSVINILMQLRKVCNHPNLFDPRPIVSPFRMEAVNYSTASLVIDACATHPLQNTSLILPGLANAEMLPTYAARFVREHRTPRKLIEEIGSSPPSPHKGETQSSLSQSPGSSGLSLFERIDSWMSGSSVDMETDQLHTQSVDSGISMAASIIERKRQQHQKERLARTAKLNDLRCSECLPVYAQDTVQCVQSLGRQLSRQVVLFSDAVCQLLKITPEMVAERLQDVAERFVFAVPPVTAPRITMHAPHCPPSWSNSVRRLQQTLISELVPRSRLLHKVTRATLVQFPENRLIQYDCGKLQVMSILLRRLKSEGHRVLIFTQMTRMLDVLESFLSFHGHRYLRLDGTTKVEQRQLLMDRFNMDRRIFCFILSTRSGGLGVNLTGADTVIFYDSDWNPTMDAQAQDRCHRIGQTRDVHIYRMISEKTVEENILKKANQKRHLGDVAIEGGNFTTAFFKQQAIRDLFEEPTGLQSLADEKEAASKLVEERDTNSRPQPRVDAEPVVKVTPVAENKVDADATPADAASQNGEATKPTQQDLTLDQLEQCLCAAEEETDVQAAKIVKAEQRAELAEFDENIPWDEREAEVRREQDEELSKVEQELMMLDKELRPIERYCVRVLETEQSSLDADGREDTQESIAAAKEGWELGRLKALREAEERRAELEDDEMLFTYSRDDASQVKKRAVKVVREREPRAAERRPIQPPARLYSDSKRDSDGGGYSPQPKRGRGAKKVIVEPRRSMGKSKSHSDSVANLSDLDSPNVPNVSRRGRGRGRGWNRINAQASATRTPVVNHSERPVRGGRGGRPRGRGGLVRQDMRSEGGRKVAPGAGVSRRRSSEQFEEIEVNEVFGSISEDGSFLMDDLNASDLLSSNDDHRFYSPDTLLSKASLSEDSPTDSSAGNRMKRQPKRALSNDYCWEPLRPRKSSRDTDEGSSQAAVVNTPDATKKLNSVTISSNSLSAGAGGYVIRHALMPGAGRGVVASGGVRPQGVPLVQTQLTSSQLSTLHVAGTNMVLSPVSSLAQPQHRPRVTLNPLGGLSVTRMVGTPQAFGNHQPLVITNGRAPGVRLLQPGQQQQQVLVRGRLTAPVVRSVIRQRGPNVSTLLSPRVGAGNLVAGSPRIVTVSPQSVLVNAARVMRPTVGPPVARPAQQQSLTVSPSTTQYILASPSSLQDRNLFLSFVQQPLTQTVVQLKTQPSTVMASAIPLQVNAAVPQLNVVYQPSAVNTSVHSVPILEKMALQLQGTNYVQPSSGVQFVQIINPQTPRTG